MRWPKYWSFSFSIIPSNEYSGMISFRMDWLDLLAVQGVAKSQTQLSNFTFTFHFHALEKEMATHSGGFLPGESQGRGSLVGGHLWGRTE